jgi:hypothetical protein
MRLKFLKFEKGKTMTKKIKSKNAVKKKSESEMLLAALKILGGPPRADAGDVDRGDRRKELLAKVAGSVAAGLVTQPSPSIASAAGMATAAVDIADEILKKAGIPSVESTVESSSMDDNTSAGAAS